MALHFDIKMLPLYSLDVYGDAIVWLASACLNYMKLLVAFRV
jgi:hypothetical protein